MEPEPYVWAIYVSSFAAVERNKGYNQLYLIQLGEARKLGNRNERRREGKRWANPSPNCIRYGWFWLPFQCVFLWVASPLPGKLARVGGHRRQPVLNPAMHKASDAGHIGPHGMRRCLSFSYRETRRPTPPPRGKNRLVFEECSMCIKHRKYRQKWRLGGVGLGQGAGAEKR